MKKIFLFLFLFLGSLNNVSAEPVRIVSGDEKAKITIIAYESLTCSHCASFHKDVYPQLKKDYIDKNIVRFEHHAFPLDLAALNAEIIVRCQVDKNISFQLLGEIYKKQNQ